jgi:hypothetical protein
VSTVSQEESIHNDAKGKLLELEGAFSLNLSRLQNYLLLRQALALEDITALLAQSILLKHEVPVAGTAPSKVPFEEVAP